MLQAMLMQCVQRVLAIATPLVHDSIPCFILRTPKTNSSWKQKKQVQHQPLQGAAVVEDFGSCDRCFHDLSATPFIRITCPRWMTRKEGAIVLTLRLVLTVESMSR
jgi:hypothetical protein